MVGTPCYLSPEICDNKPYDGKSDIWALGCVLYELCALKNAFSGTSLPATILKVLRGLYKPISSKYSVELQKLLDKLLTRDPQKRPSIGEVLSPQPTPRSNDIHVTIVRSSRCPG